MQHTISAKRPTIFLELSTELSLQKAKNSKRNKNGLNGGFFIMVTLDFWVSKQLF